MAKKTVAKIYSAMRSDKLDLRESLFLIAYSAMRSSSCNCRTAGLKEGKTVLFFDCTKQIPLNCCGLTENIFLASRAIFFRNTKKANSWTVGEISFCFAKTNPLDCCGLTENRTRNSAMRMPRYTTYL